MSVNDLTDYELRNLPAHLFVLGRTQDLAGLLWRSGEGQAENLWYDTKRRAFGLGAYLEDLELFSGAISNDGTGDSAARALSMLRYALLSTSVNSGFEKYPANVFGAAARAGFWSVTEAIDRAARVPDPEVRASAMLGLLSVVDREAQAGVVPVILDTARQLETDSRKGELLVGLLDAAPEVSLPGVMAIVDSLETPYARARVHARIAALLPPAEQHARVLEILQLVPFCGELGSMGELFHDLAPLLAVDDAAAVLDAVAGIHWPESRFDALAQVLDIMSSEQMTDILSQVYSAQPDPEEIRAESMRWAGRIAAGEGINELGPSGERVAMMFAVEMIRQLEGSRSRLVVAVTDQDAGWSAGQALNAAEAILDPVARSSALIAIAKRVSEPWPILQACLDVAGYAAQKGGAEMSVQIVTDVAACVDDVNQATLLRHAELEASRIDEPLVRAVALSRVARLSDREIGTGLACTALELATANEGSNLGMEDLADQEGNWIEADDATAIAVDVRRDRVSEQQREIVELLEPVLKPEVFPALLGMMATIARPRERARALMSVERLLDSQARDEAFEGLVRYASGGGLEVFAATLAGLRLPPTAAGLALSLVMQVNESSENHAREAIDALVPVLSAAQLAEVLSRFGIVGDHSAMSKTRSVLAVLRDEDAGSAGTIREPSSDLLRGDTREREDLGTISTIVAAARTGRQAVIDDAKYVLALEDRPDLFEAPVHQSLLDRGPADLAGLTHYETMVFVSRYLDANPAAAAQVLEALAVLSDEAARSWGLVAFGMYAPPEDRRRAAHMVTQLTDHRHQARALSAFYDLFSPESVHALSTEILTTAHELSEKAVVSMLGDLAPALPDDLRDLVRVRVRAFNHPQYRVMALLRTMNGAPDILDEGLWWEMIEMAIAVTTPTLDVKWVNRVCASMPPELWPAILSRLDQIDDDHRNTVIFNAALEAPQLVSPAALDLVTAMSPCGGAEFLGVLARHLPDEAIDSARAFTSGCTHAPTAMEAQLRLALRLAPADRWATASNAVAQLSESDTHEEDRYLSAAIELLGDAPPEIKLDAFKQVILNSATKSRPDLLRRIRQVALLLPSLGSHALLTDCIDSIDMCGRWWP